MHPVDSCDDSREMGELEDVFALLDLPFVPLFHVLGLLPHTSLLPLAASCKYLHTIVHSSPSLWRRLLLKHRDMWPKMKFCISCDMIRKTPSLKEGLSHALLFSNLLRIQAVSLNLHYPLNWG